MGEDISFRIEEILKSMSSYKDRGNVEEAFRHK